jgi:hypothetical protein
VSQWFDLQVVTLMVLLLPLLLRCLFLLLLPLALVLLQSMPGCAFSVDSLQV